MTDISTLVKNHKPGFSLEQAFYRDAEIYEREIERIFLKTWLYVGHDSQIPKAGDYFLFEIADESVIITRDKGGDIHALVNVCRHRGSRVCLESKGSQRVLVCPYHAWSYDLSGRLRSAGQAGSDFDKQNLGLKRLWVRLLHGLIFINFADDPVSFDPIEHELATRLKPYGLDRAKVAHGGEASRALESDSRGRTKCGPVHGRVQPHIYERRGDRKRALVRALSPARGFSDGKRGWEAGRAPSRRAEALCRCRNGRSDRLTDLLSRLRGPRRVISIHSDVAPRVEV
ncbi:MAG: Rieske (2Fe-2S) protein [Deltaproteobacteria bacterium]|nr:Rieske (2Fe-2S) protein [Deltaproteobacteria bacterium]